ncbi:hypothetical protein KK083_25860 [Fulvivirgaceae bacterium PWU4]|uniref:O-antigen ligase family protein n=1 Tax=Chryseosolibacter histidini TaxID=2782349 RepID=A0AAP2DRU8_9BACT|nr:O-antigen ligase family protein [Chryseosolibacter histidini]MBT1700339.1 hypothetical protein [Chryseosolibacter histidini]
MIYKRDIVNFLFVTSFSVVGLGRYVSGSMSPSLGYIVGLAPYLLILLFYGVNLLYKREFQIRLNRNYWLMLAFLLSTVISLFVSFRKNLPNLDFQFTMIRSVVLLVPFHAFLVVMLYNRGKDNLFRLTLMGLNLLLFINVVGFYGLGLSNQVHAIEGRINFPFLEALYSGAGLVVIISLMVLYRLGSTWNYPLKFSGLLAYLLVNVFFLFYINSRLVIIIFIVVMLVYFFKLGNRFSYLFLCSFFTLPLLLNTGKLIYEILSLPVFVSLLQRVDMFDIITFNGRSLLWENVFDWMMFDQRGFIFGNGFQGHYFLGIEYDVAKLFGIKDLDSLHLHSAVLEIIVNQGIVGILLLMVIFFKTCRYFKKLYDQHASDGAFYYVLVFMMLLLHVDMLQYMDNFGSIVFSLLVARIVVKQDERPALNLVVQS